MPFDAKQFSEGVSYDGVIRACRVVESSNQNPGIWLNVETESGYIDGSFYVTPDTRDRFQETFEQLGVTLDVLAGDAFWEDPSSILNETECSIVPEINEYKGKEHWRVKWLNPRRKQASIGAKQRAAAMFRSQGSVVAGNGALAPSDPDCPF